jgi:two-component sensor histidine kinase
VTNRDLAKGRLSEWIVTLPAFRHLNASPFSISLWQGYLFAVTAFVLAFVTRQALGSALPPGFPFVTFLPAVLITAFVFGLWPGILCAVLSTTAAWLVFLPESGRGSSVLALAFFIVTAAIIIAPIHAMHIALARATRLQQLTERLARDRALYVAELDHRIKNIFASISSLVSMASRSATDPKQLADSVRERIQALAGITTILRGSEAGNGSTMSEIVSLVTTPLAQDGNIEIDRRSLDIPVSANAAISFSLIFHELATNALKHGALSVPKGRVRIFATAVGDESVHSVVWEETGGPPPHIGLSTGFGSVLLAKVPRALGGTLDFDYKPSGLVAVLCVPPQRDANTTLPS